MSIVSIFPVVFRRFHFPLFSFRFHRFHRFQRLIRFHFCVPPFSARTTHWLIDYRADSLPFKIAPSLTITLEPGRILCGCAASCWRAVLRALKREARGEPGQRSWLRAGRRSPIRLRRLPFAQLGARNFWRKLRSLPLHIILQNDSQVRRLVSMFFLRLIPMKTIF